MECCCFLLSTESNDTLINIGSAVSTPVNINAPPMKPNVDLLGSIVRSSVSSAEGKFGNVMRHGPLVGIDSVEGDGNRPRNKI